MYQVRLQIMQLLCFNPLLLLFWRHTKVKLFPCLCPLHSASVLASFALNWLWRCKQGQQKDTLAKKLHVMSHGGEMKHSDVISHVYLFLGIGNAFQTGVGFYGCVFCIRYYQFACLLACLMWTAKQSGYLFANLLLLEQQKTNLGIPF